MPRRLFVVALLFVVAGCAGEPSRADLEAVATSDQANRDRTVATKAAGDELAALASVLPWLDWQQRAIDQTCEPESAGLISQTYWVWCTTSVTTYAGFTGDLAAEILHSDKAVLAAGWNADGAPASGVARSYRRVRSPLWSATGRPGRPCAGRSTGG